MSWNENKKNTVNDDMSLCLLHLTIKEARATGQDRVGCKRRIYRRPGLVKVDNFTLLRVGKSLELGCRCSNTIVSRMQPHLQACFTLGTGCGH